MIVSKPREALWAFLNDRLQLPWSSDFRAIGVLRDGCLLAAVGYNGFTGRTCMMHSAIDDPSAISRTFVRAVFEYPFSQANVSVAIATVEDTNKASIKLVTRLGFKEFHRLEGAGLKGNDLILYKLRAEEFNWLRKYNVEECTGSA